MLFQKIRNKLNHYDKALELCVSIEKRLIDIEERLIHAEERLIHMEERLEHVEERCKIVDEDKIEDIRSRIIHIEDKENVVMNQNTGDIYVSFE